MALIIGVQYSGNPAGTIIPCGNGSALPRTLLCDGTAYSRPISAGGTVDTYKDLYNAIGTTYGTGDGSTTFNVPNTQGIFLRGAGSQTISAVTYTGTRGTKQNDGFASHDHGGGNHNHGIKFYAGGPAGNNDGVIGSGNWQTTNNNTSIASGAIIAAAGSGTETKPANLGVTYCIAY